MDPFFIKEFTGGPFQLFSTSHLIALGIILAAIVFLVVSRNRLSPTQQRRLRLGAAILLIVNELAWHAWNLLTNQWTLQTMLPFHLCSVLVWLSAYMLIKKSFRIYEFAYLLGIPGALQALLTPDLGIYDFPHFRYFQVFISHGLIVLSALYMTLVEKYRPIPRSLLRVLIFANLYMVVITGLNFIIGSNYLFTAHKPETASLLDILPPWPWYLLIIELLGIVFVGIFYLPFAIKDARKK
jgi:hypothetical integral membrane protein (TIGR02206 family)